MQIQEEQKEQLSKQTTRSRSKSKSKSKSRSRSRSQEKKQIQKLKNFIFDTAQYIVNIEKMVCDLNQTNDQKLAYYTVQWHTQENHTLPINMIQYYQLDDRVIAKIGYLYKEAKTYDVKTKKETQTPEWLWKVEFSRNYGDQIFKIFSVYDIQNNSFYKHLTSMINKFNF